MKIKLLGVGGAGVNILNQMSLKSMVRMEMMVMDTDVRALAESVVENRLQIGQDVTYGLGAGGDQAIGWHAAKESEPCIADAVGGIDVLIMVTGLGGGTATGAAPLIAEAAKARGAAVIALVVQPFDFEGERRRGLALVGLHDLHGACDAVFTFANQGLWDGWVKSGAPGETIFDLFERNNYFVGNAVSSIHQLLIQSGMFKLELADILNALCLPEMKAGQSCWFGLGVGQGAQRISESVKQLSSCPLLADSKERAKAGIEQALLAIAGGMNMTLSDIQTVIQSVEKTLPKGTKLVRGTSVDPQLHDQIRVTLMAIGRGESLVGECVSHLLGELVDPVVFSGKGRVPEKVAGSSLGLGEKKVVVAEDAAETLVEGMYAGETELGQNKQETFGFAETNAPSRGCFDKTEPTMHNGVDLDQPAYLRKKVKLRQVAS